MFVFGYLCFAEHRSTGARERGILGRAKLLGVVLKFQIHCGTLPCEQFDYYLLGLARRIFMSREAVIQQFSCKLTLVPECFVAEADFDG